MRVTLLQPADIAAPAEMPEAAELEQDLELAVLLDAMAEGDDLVRATARAVLLAEGTEPDVVAHRQAALQDVLRDPAPIEVLDDLATRALATPRQVFSVLASRRPEPVLQHAVGVLQLLLPLLVELHEWAVTNADGFESAAFRELVAVLRSELAEDRLAAMRRVVRLLEPRDGILMSAGLSPVAAVDPQVLRLPRDENRHLLNRTPLARPAVSFTIPERDQAGWTALSDLLDRGLNDAADATAQAVDHVLGFFRALRRDLAFYRGAARLHDALGELRTPMCLPLIGDDRGLQAEGLVDPCLALRTRTAPVGNAVSLGDAGLLVVTGANHGGKSTFLRAIGVAQLMAQAGLFVAADSFGTACSGRLLSHWSREEDAGLQHGRLDEELERMSRIADAARPGDTLLSNESFSSTNEREGAEIALHVVRAMQDAGVRIRLVTHNTTLARALAEAPGAAVFLRAARGEDGERPYRLEPGEPLPTSYGMDLFDRTFGTHLAAPRRTGDEEAPDHDR